MQGKTTKMVYKTQNQQVQPSNHIKKHFFLPPKQCSLSHSSYQPSEGTITPLKSTFYHQPHAIYMNHITSIQQVFPKPRTVHGISTVHICSTRQLKSFQSQVSTFIQMTKILSREIGLYYFMGKLESNFTRKMLLI